MTAVASPFRREASSTVTAVTHSQPSTSTPRATADTGAGGGTRRTAANTGMVLSVEHNETAIVVRTRIGRAPAVGIELDGLRHPEILGTIQVSTVNKVLNATATPRSDPHDRDIEVCFLL